MLFLKKALKTVGQYYLIIAVTVSSFLFLLLVFNEGMTYYLQRHPKMLMSAADRINENTRAIREEMIPSDKVVEWYDLQHPSQVKDMWGEFYEATPIFESYTHYRPKAFLGKFYKVTEAGFRMTKDQGPWPPSIENFNVFFFGGSTAFGVGPAWATVASYLQDAMNEHGGAKEQKVYVYNFGRSGYMSTQESILFQNLIRDGHIPNMAVFLDGLNDFCWHDGQPSSWQTLAQHFNQVNEDYRAQMAGYGITTRWNYLRDFFRSLPITRAFDTLLYKSNNQDIPRYQKDTEVKETAEDETVLTQIINRYFHNIRQTRGISMAYGIIPIFVWQPIPTYKYDMRHHLFKPDRLHCHINSKVGYPMVANYLLKLPSHSDFIWAADMQERAKEPLYVDAFHYTAPMSRKLATFIASQIIKRDLMTYSQSHP